MKNEYEGKSIEQLKVIVYDLLVEQQVVNNKLQVVNTLIAQQKSKEIKKLILNNYIVIF